MGDVVAVRQYRVIVTGEQAHKVGVNEQLFAAHLDLTQHAQVGQLFEIDRPSLALGDARFHQVLDAAIGLHKQHVDQLTRVDLAGVSFDEGGGLRVQFLDSLNLRRGPLCGVGEGR